MTKTIRGYTSRRRRKRSRVFASNYRGDIQYLLEVLYNKP